LKQVLFIILDVFVKTSNEISEKLDLVIAYIYQNKLINNQHNN
jgi:hypothetical protein